MEKILENLYEAKQRIQKIDHILYITYPLIKDKKLLLKIIVEIKIAITKLITCILQYEYLYKRIRLQKNPRQNLEIFKLKCAPRYEIQIHETKLIQKIIDIVEIHKNSPFEFRKQEKIIILTKDSSPIVIVLKDIKDFLELAKKILKKTTERIK
jgi:hypothetical protein